MLCNTTSSLIVRGAESAVQCGEAAQRGLAPCTALSGTGEGGRWRRRRGARRWRRWCGRRDDRGGGGIDRGGGGHERSGARRGGGGGEAPVSRGARAIRGTRRCEMEGGGDGGEAARTAAPSLGERRREEEQRRRSLAVDGSAFEPGSPCHCDRRARERRSRARRHSRRARDLRGVGSPEGSGLLGRRPAARKEAGAAEAA